MGVGHLAIALLCRRADPAINLGVLFFAVMLADFLLGVFFWLGLETATVPAGFEHLHYLNFTFPYSHGLVASLCWSIAAMLMSLALWKRGKSRSAIVIFLAVFSHFILDSIVHVPGVPLFGVDSPRVGLRLWSNMKAALTLEMLLAIIGMIVFWPAATKTFRGKWGGTNSCASIFAPHCFRNDRLRTAATLRTGNRVGPDADSCQPDRILT